MTAYCVIGSQAQISSKNSVTVMKMSQLHKTKRRRRKNQLREEEDEAGESSDEDSDEVASFMSSRPVPVPEEFLTHTVVLFLWGMTRTRRRRIRSWRATR
mmetsp:Transcript_24310/g.95690  ORF Transcript_24310/g.95690 Transcript_24310/m.95690 type:complete len:100 (+) Transcript_24310:604-903(+)